MQLQGTLQQAACAANQGHSKPAQGLAGNPLAAHNHAGAHQQLSGAWNSQPTTDAASREAIHHSLEKGELCLCCNCLLCVPDSNTVKHCVIIC